MKLNVTPFSAQSYDNEIQRTLPCYDEFFSQITEIVKAAADGPLNWLDAGCGTGKMAESALLQTDVKRMVLCDSDPLMLNTARTRSFPASAELVLCGCEQLTFFEEFDVVTAVLVNHYLPDEKRARAISNYYRALKTGGLYFSVENFAPRCPDIEALFLRRWAAYQNARGKSREDCARHVARYGKSYYPLTLEDNLRLIKDCGFRSAEIFWLSNMQAGFLAIK